MTKYVAKLNGKIVGKRTTKRTYTHAVIVQRDADHFRRRAAERTPAQIAQDRKNYAYYVQCATGTYVGTFNDGKTFTSKIEGAQLVHAKNVAAMSVDGYIAHLRAQAQNSFAEQLSKGYFEPFVAGWAGRADLAQKAAAQHTHPGCNLVAIVPAEEV